MGDDGFMQRASANQQEAACRNRLQGHAILFIGLTQNGQTLFLNRRAGNVDHAPISVNGHMQILRETGAGRQMDVQDSWFGDWPLHRTRHAMAVAQSGGDRGGSSVCPITRLSLTPALAEVGRLMRRAGYYCGLAPS